MHTYFILVSNAVFFRIVHCKIYYIVVFECLPACKAQRVRVCAAQEVAAILRSLFQETHDAKPSTPSSSYQKSFLLSTRGGVEGVSNITANVIPDTDNETSHSVESEFQPPPPFPLNIHAN